MTHVGLEKLMSIVAQLRNPDGGCPWDLEQTTLTLCPMMVEEAYEIIEAIERTTRIISRKSWEIYSSTW